MQDAKNDHSLQQTSKHIPLRAAGCVPPDRCALFFLFIRLLLLLLVKQKQQSVVVELGVTKGRYEEQYVPHPWICVTNCCLMSEICCTA